MTNLLRPKGNLPRKLILILDHFARVTSAFAEGLHELRWHQLHGMAEGQQLATEMIGSDASFHADQAGWHMGKALLHLPAGELLAQDNGAARIQTDQVEAILADVDARVETC